MPMTTAEAAEEIDGDNKRDADDDGDGSDAEDEHIDETLFVVCAPITAVREYGTSCKDGGEREV